MERGMLRELAVAQDKRDFTPDGASEEVEDIVEQVIRENIYGSRRDQEIGEQIDREGFIKPAAGYLAA